jgi:hypothetical protein
MGFEGFAAVQVSLCCWQSGSGRQSAGLHAMLAVEELEVFMTQQAELLNRIDKIPPKYFSEVIDF